MKIYSIQVALLNSIQICFISKIPKLFCVVLFHNMFQTWHTCTYSCIGTVKKNLSWYNFFYEKNFWTSEVSEINI